MIESIYYDLKQKTGLSPSLTTQVAKSIGRSIVSRQYASGDLIEDETALAEQYKVSRSVVRDAVKILVGKGLLEVRRGIGTRVNPRESWGLFDDDVLAWSQSAPPDPVTLLKLTELRQIIEPPAARWAAERGTAEMHADIKTALENMEASIGKLQEFVTADAEFHRAILRSTDNEYLMALEGLVFTGLLSSIQLTNLTREDNILSVPFHRDICDAIIARNGDLAERAMRKLIEDAGTRLSARLMKAGIQDKNEDFARGTIARGKVGSES